MSASNRSPQTLRVDVVTDPDDRPIMLRLLAPGPRQSGTATLDLSADCMLVVDALLPDRGVEVVASMPFSSLTIQRCAEVIGHDLRDLREGQEAVVQPTDALRVLGRIALLDLLRLGGPLPTRNSLWLLERLRLAGRVPQFGLVNESLEQLRPYATALGRIAERMGTKGGHLRALLTQLREWPVTEGPIPALVEEVCITIGRWLDTSATVLPSGTSQFEGQYSLEWDQVPAGLLNPRENSVFADLDAASGRIEIWAPMVVDREPQRPLYARVWLLQDGGDAVADRRPVAAPMERSGMTVEAVIDDDRLVGRALEDVVVEIADAPDGEFKTLEQRAVARGRRAAYWAGLEARRLRQLQEVLSEREWKELDQPAHEALDRELRAIVDAYESVGFSDEAKAAESIIGTPLHMFPAPFLAEIEADDPEIFERNGV